MKIEYCYKTNDDNYTLTGVDKKEVIKILKDRVEDKISYFTNDVTKAKIEVLQELK